VNDSMTKFSLQMQAKMKDVEARLETLKNATQTQAAHADKAIRAHVETLEDSAHKAKESLDRARNEMASWVEDAKETVIGWKAKLDTTMLHARADRAEHYAEAALVVALAGVDQAEKAMLSAGLARSEAEAVKAA
jgi:DNA polymerase I-like protein with 3'-5' exonuclease and polymerase domains